MGARLAIYVSLEEAISISYNNIQTIGNEYIHIDDAFLRVTAEDITCPANVPNFNRSAMDGYAISNEDLGKLENSFPLTLNITDVIKAGSVEKKYLKPGETYSIMTGALLPRGCAAVIKQESIIKKGNSIIINNLLQPGENIHPAGYILKSGDSIAPKGHMLTAETLERIAAGGIEKILVCKVPRIYIIGTGSELLLPGTPIQNGLIYNSSRTLMSNKIKDAGAIPVLADSVIEDNLPAIMNEIEKAITVADMVIITGGTGNGIYDLVFKSLTDLRADILFKGVNIIPGKGTSAAMFNGKLLYNLPGNPYAGSLLFEALIKPALMKLKGIPLLNLEWLDMPLFSPVKGIKPVRSLQRGEMIIKQGCVYAQPINKNENHSGFIPLLLDLQPGQGLKGDFVKVRLI